MGWDDPAIGMKMRDLITNIATGVVNQIRPEPRVGSVVTMNYWTRRFGVQFPGEDEPIEVQGDRVNSPINFNQIVEVSGKPGAYYISRVLSDSSHLNRPYLYHPVLRGGVFHNGTFAKFFGLDGPFVTVANGNCINWGRFANAGSFEDGHATIEMYVGQAFGTDALKTYRFSMHSNPTADAWQILLPIEESGHANGIDFQMEIRTDSTGFRLRARRKNEAGAAGGSGLPRGGFWVWGAGWERDPFVAWNYEEIDTEPTAVYGQNTQPYNEANTLSKSIKGPFFDHPKTIIQRRAQEALTGGGIITWNGTRLKWSQPFSAFVGVNDYSSTGQILMAMPAVSAVIQHHGMPSPFGETSHTVDSNGISMASGSETRSVLYYDPPLRGSGATDDTRWHLVGDAVKFRVPSHWIMVATMDLRGVGIPSLKLGTMVEIDHWRSHIAGTGGAPFGGTVNWCEYTYSNGYVYFRLNRVINAAYNPTAADGNFANVQILGNNLPTEILPSRNVNIPSRFDDVPWGVVVTTAGDLTAVGGPPGGRAFASGQVMDCNGGWPLR